MGDYFQTMGDVNKLTYNLFHNAGGIYDTTADLIALVRYGDPNDRAYWKQIGSSAGYMFKSISYKPKNYDPYNPKSKKKWGWSLLSAH